jgi:long-chain acyl-CoA synthetase
MEKNWLKNWPSDVPMEIAYLQGSKPLFEYLRVHAGTWPDKTAINYCGLKVSYAEIDWLTDNFATYLSREGVRKGDRVAMMGSIKNQGH